MPESPLRSRQSRHLRSLTGSVEPTPVIACLPGDGIGPEVLEQAVRVLEQRLRQTVIELQARNEELASLDRLKSQLLANVSHELRTPLVTIKGYNELLLRGSLGPLSERQERALKSTAQSTERLIELIETLLDFAQREEGRPSLRRERFDLRQVVRDVVDVDRVHQRAAPGQVVLLGRDSQHPGAHGKSTPLFFGAPWRNGDVVA